MTIANASQGTDCGLPQALKTAGEAIDLPEVQEMLRRLSEYKLGIFMPHMHDENTGEFRPLPDELVQVESGLEVAFQPTGEIANRMDRFLAVGWSWRGGGPAPVAVCEMVWEGGRGDSGRAGKHKMNKANG